MNKDERLLPLPGDNDLHLAHNDVPSSYSPFYDDESFDEKRSIREYFNVVYKRLPIILAMTILTTAAVAFYMYRQPSVYQATTGMIIEPRKPKVQTNININFGNDANYYQTQLMLLENPDLMRDVVIRLGLHRQPDVFGGQNKGVISTFRSMFGGKKTDAEQDSLPTITETQATENSPEQIALTPEEKERTNEYAGIFLFGLDVEQVERTNLVNVSVQSTNPELAAKVADTVAEVFIEQDIQRETQGAKKAYQEISKSIEDLRETIAGQESQLIALLQSANLPLQDQGSELRNSILQTLYGQYQEARNERLKIEARYNTAVRANSRGEGKNIPDITNNEIYRDTVRLNRERKAKLEDRIIEIDKQIQEFESEKAELLVKYQPEYYKVKQVDEKIAALKGTRIKTEREFSDIIDRDEKKIEKDAVTGALVGLKSQLESAQKREGQLYTAYKAEESKANVEGIAETKLTTLKRAIETNRKLLDDYSQQQKQRELEIAGTRPDNLKISTEAQIPTAPIGPQRNRNIIVAFMISLVAGMGLAFLLDYLDDSVRTSDDIGRNLALPTLALIPYQSGSGERRKLLLGSKNGNGAGASTALITLEDNRSPMAEAYRHLRTSLLFSSAGKPPQTILVTSSQPAEGKTTTAINTAITLAQSGAEVVIIDCDLRRPRLHNHFGLENLKGLTNYLSGDKNPSNMLNSYPKLPNLKIITSGPIPPNPAELLSSNEMKNLLQFLRGNFKHVIIDSPPAISFTDAAILSTLVDGVVLVAMAGKSSIHLMRRFKQRLANIGARIYGVVLNGIKSNSVEYGYYGYSYSNYYAATRDDSTPLLEEVEDFEEVASIHDTNP